MVKPVLGKSAASKTGGKNSAKMAQAEELETGFALNVLGRECKAEGSECIVDSDEEISFNYPCLMSFEESKSPLRNVHSNDVFVGIIDSGCSAHLTPSEAILNKWEGGGR